VQKPRGKRNALREREDEKEKIELRSGHVRMPLVSKLAISVLMAALNDLLRLNHQQFSVMFSGGITCIVLLDH